MADIKRVSISVVDGRKWRWLKAIVSILLICVVPISIGVYLQSTAMQWMGFILSVFGIFALANSSVKKFNSVERAKAYLDSIKDE